MFDVFVLAAVVDELTTRLVPGRVQRVLLLDETTLGLEVYSHHQRHQLVISADAQTARVHLAGQRLTADRETVTPFLLLLRKYVRGATLLAVDQSDLERVVTFVFARWLPLEESEATPDQATGAGPSEVETEAEAADERPGYEVVVRLVVEIMGRHSNVILVDNAGRIMDSIKRVPPRVNRYRSVLPRREYLPPPPQVKVDPRHLTVGTLQAAAVASETIEARLVRLLRGVGPQLAREIVARAADQATPPLAEPGAADIVRAVQTVFGYLVGGWQPQVYRRDGAVVDYSAFPLRSRADCVAELCDGPSAAVEVGTGAVAVVSGHAQSRRHLVERLHEDLHRARARAHALQEEAAGAAAAEALRTAGEMIYAFQHEIRAGQGRLAVLGQTIELDSALTPGENARAYFERYRKARAASAAVPARLEAAQLAVDYLEQLAALAERADGLSDLESIEAEWREAGRGSARPPRSGPGRPPRRFATARGERIAIGRNGRQNDEVTFDLARPEDWWLHARGLPGAHVILQAPGLEDLEDASIVAAARLAAHYSTAKAATRVEVDVTRRRWVRKVKGGPPGLVTYRNERTIRVVPATADELLAERALLADAPGAATHRAASGRRGERRTSGR